MGKPSTESVLDTHAHIYPTLASAEQLNFNAPHPPNENAIEAFNLILPTIKSEILKSRSHWDKHEPRMWSRARGISDRELTDFTIEKDLVLVSRGALSRLP